MNSLPTTTFALGILAIGVPFAIGQEFIPFVAEFDKLEGAKAPVQFGDKGTSNLAFTPDARFLLTTAGMKVLMWDVRKREKISEWEVRELSSIAVTPDGSSLAVGTETGQLHLYDLSTRNRLRTWTVPNQRPVVQVAFNENGSLMAVATLCKLPNFVMDGNIYVWETKTKAEAPRYSFPDVLGYALPGYRDPLIAFVPGKKQLLSTGSAGGRDAKGDSSGPAGKALRFDLETQKPQVLLPGPAYSRIAVSRDGKFWIVNFNCWVDGKPVPATFEMKHFVQGVAANFHPDFEKYIMCPKSRYLAALMNRRFGAVPGLTVWDVIRTERQVVFKERVFINKFKTFPTTVAFSPDGTLLVAASSEAVWMWDARLLLPVRDPVFLNEDLQEELRGLRERIDTLERRIKQLESRK